MINNKKYSVVPLAVSYFFTFNSLIELPLANENNTFLVSNNEDILMDNSKYDLETPLYNSHLFAFNKMTDFELLYKKCKLCIDDIDNNEKDLINLIKANISNYWFVDFIKYYFEKNEVYMCDALICTWLESDLPIKSNAFRLALELAKKSNIKSLVAKANDILDFYF